MQITVNDKQQKSHCGYRFRGNLILAAVMLCLGLSGCSTFGGQFQDDRPGGSPVANPGSPSAPPIAAAAAESYASLVDRVAPAVVTIRAARRIRAAQQFPFLDDPCFREFFGEWFNRQNSPQCQRPEMSQWAPQSDVFERGNDLIIRADLPGMTKDDVNVDLEKDRIIIRGERRDERETDKNGYSERNYGSPYRSIPLPEGINSDLARADFSNGTLEIILPRPEQMNRGRRLEIGEGGRGNQRANQSQSNAAGRYKLRSNGVVLGMNRLFECKHK